MSRLFGATLVVAASSVPFAACASQGSVGDDQIARQNAIMLESTQGAGFGPQSPRDIGVPEGTNPRVFAPAPAMVQMNLCNIHLHEGAEHRGGEFTTYAGNGNGAGYGTGFLYDGNLTHEELAAVDFEVGEAEHGTLEPGDTIEVHFVFSTAEVVPGATLAACLDPETRNPQLRVEAQVFVLVNDDAAADFSEIAAVQTVAGFAQAVGIPADTGAPIVYLGSTTGPSYNKTASPFQVTWSVRPSVARLSIASLAEWLEHNPFGEHHAHGVRNLVVAPELLSPISN